MRFQLILAVLATAVAAIPTTADPVTCSEDGTIDESTCPSDAGENFVSSTGQDYYVRCDSFLSGDDVQAFTDYTFEQCATYCSENQSCLGFNWTCTKSGGYCQALFQNIVQSSSRQGWATGEK